MEQIHNQLCARWGWYARWHQDSYSSAVSWAIFVLVALLATTNLLAGIQDNYDVAYAPAMVINSSARPSHSELERPWATMADPLAKLGSMNDAAFAYLKTYLTGTGDARQTAYTSLEEVLSERQGLMGQVIGSNPVEAEKYYFGPVTRNAIPSELHTYLVEER